MKILILLLITISLLTSCNRYLYPEISHPPEYNNIDLKIDNTPERIIYSDKIVNV